jgi:hypothetical protein
MAYTTIDKPTDYFNTKTYTGTATSSGDTQAVTGVGFQPDWVWIKNRDGAYQHVLYDVIRGVNKEVRSSQNIAEVDSGTNGYLSAFDSDGFTTTRGTNTGNHVNVSGTGFVSWNWLAGGTASSNTDGSITSSVSANIDAGFSIGTFTGNATAGSTIGHGLNATPAWIICRTISAAKDWCVYHHKNTSAPETEVLILNSTAATLDTNDRWNDTAPTSSVFTIGDSSQLNTNGGTSLFYAFAEKKGYSKFGSYEGNNSANGSFIYTGFSVSWVMIKNIDTSGTAWVIQDSKRSGSSGGNPANKRIRANASNAEETDSPVDLLSNGFKIRSTGSFTSDANTYIYMAFAESPFVTSTGIPTTAR